MREWKIPLAHIVQHHHWSGKNCPNRLRRGEPYSWETFLEKVQMFYEGRQQTPNGDAAEEDSLLYTVQSGAFHSKQNARTLADELEDKGFDAYITTKGA